MFADDGYSEDDYYPFGMQMPGRKYSNGDGYRYGFNGQEKSDEIAAGLTTAMFWEYDSRIGRRWNLDPIPKIGESEYMCFGGNPIYLSDALGNQPDPPGKGYNWAEAHRAACIHFLGARMAFKMLEARAEQNAWGWKYNKGADKVFKNWMSSYYKDNNIADCGISQDAFAQVATDYYKKFEKAFNWSGKETVKELGFIFNNKYSNARDIFKPNLNYSTSEGYNAIWSCIGMFDDMEDWCYTRVQKSEEIFMKCAMFTAMWATSGVGSGTSFSSGTMPGLQENRRTIRTSPVIPISKEEQIAELLQAGNQMDRGGLTKVGRALQKHGNRDGSLFPRVAGTAEEINAQGESVLREILANPVEIVKRKHAKFGNILEYRTAGGQGARFSADGKTFIGFL